MGQIASCIEIPCKINFLQNLPEINRDGDYPSERNLIILIQF